MKKFSKFFMAGLIFAALILAGCKEAITNIIPSSQTGTIKGKAVYSNGDTNAGINITIEKLVNGRSVILDNENAVVYRTVTDADGEYEVTNVETGIYKVYAESAAAKEDAAVSDEVEVSPGETVTVEDLKLTAVGSISGIATFREEAMQGILVYIAGTSYNAKTDEDGKYVISGVPADEEYILVAETANGKYSTKAEEPIKVKANATVEAEELVIWGNWEISHIKECTPMEGGIYFRIAVPRYSAGKSMMLDVETSGTRYTWTNPAVDYYSSEPTNHAFVFPFVEKDKEYTFIIRYRDSEWSYYLFEERITVKAIGGLGEISIENEDEINLAIETNTKDSVIVKIDEQPKIKDFGTAYTLMNHYELITTKDGNYGRWLYGFDRSLVDERSMKFDILSPDSYKGEWRDAGTIKGFIWGNDFRVTLAAIITLPNSDGFFVHDIVGVNGTNPADKVQVTVNFNKGIALEIEKDEVETLTFGSDEYNKFIKRGGEISLAGTPASKTIDFGEMVAEPTGIPTLKLVGEYNEAPMEYPTEFVGWGYTSGNKFSFTSSIEPVENGEPLKEYNIYPIFIVKPIKLIFDTDGGSFVPGRYGYIYNHVNLETPEKEGFKFGGWYYDKDFKKPFYEYIEEDFYLSEDFSFEVTVYAKWLSPCKVTFVTNSDTELKEVIAYEDESFTPPTPKKEGYVLEGWYLDEGFTKLFEGSVNKDITLYAKWVKFEDIVDQIMTFKGDAKGELELGDGWAVYNKTDDYETSEENLGGYCLKCSPEGMYDYKSVTLKVTDCSYISFSLINAGIGDYGGIGYLEFYVDGIRQDYWNYEFEWRNYYRNITFGEHTFRWEFYKTYGNAYALIDNIIIEGEKPTEE